MNLLPMVTRELRVQSRQRINFRLRYGSALLAFFLMMVALWAHPQATERAGAGAFGRIYLTLICAIGLVAPVLAADSISRERREGTLDILFLTKVSAHEMVLAKLLIHGLRAGCMVLAVVPVLGLCLFMGGVTLEDYVTGIVLAFATLAICLSGGILASSSCLRRSSATAVAFLFSFALLCFFWWGMTFAFEAVFPISYSQALRKALSNPGSGFLVDMMPPGVDLFGLYRGKPIWSRVIPSTGVGWQVNWYFFIFYAGCLSACISGLCWLLAVLNLRKIARERDEVVDSEAQRRWFKPVFFQPQLHTRRHRELDINPIRWLQEYSWVARATKWAWLLVVLVPGLALIYFSTLRFSNFESALYGFMWLGFFLSAGMAYTSASSFWYERQSGAMELLLVAPLTERQIIAGRLRGIQAQFFPACVALGSLVLFMVVHPQSMGNIRMPSGLLVGEVALLVGIFLNTPLIGMAFATRASTLFRSWLCTVILGVLLPGFISFTLGIGSESGLYGWIFLGAGLVGQFLLGIEARGCLVRDLSQRAFALGPVILEAGASEVPEPE